MFERVREIIAQQLGIDESVITLESSIVDDLGADSLDVLELVMAFSEEFEVDIPDEEADKIATVGDVVDYVKEHKD